MATYSDRETQRIRDVTTGLARDYTETALIYVDQFQNRELREAIMDDLDKHLDAMNTSGRLLTGIALCRWLQDAMAQQNRVPGYLAEWHTQLLEIAMAKLEPLVQERFEDLRHQRQTNADAWNDAQVEIHEAATEAVNNAVATFNAYLDRLNAYYRQQAEAARDGRTWNMDPRVGPEPDGDSVMGEAADHAAFEHDQGFQGGTIQDAFVPSAPVILQKPMRRTGMMFR